RDRSWESTVPSETGGADIEEKPLNGGLSIDLFLILSVELCVPVGEAEQQKTRPPLLRRPTRASRGKRYRAFRFQLVLVSLLKNVQEHVPIWFFIYPIQSREQAFADMG
ncbi:hypothetical protein CRG98_010781, partial [Punica granatum]